MDDEMFAEIAQGSFLPNGSSVAFKPPTNKVAEPAKLMVLVDRPPESLFGRIKTYTFLGLVICFGFFVIYKYFVWKGTQRPYEGRALPGAIPEVKVVQSVGPEDVPTTIDVALESKRILATTMMQEPVVERERPMEPLEDIVMVMGPIPTWEHAEEPIETFEGRVDENTPHVQGLLSAREEFNQRLEEELAQSVKDQRNATSN
jgi:hypothetical protein